VLVTVVRIIGAGRLTQDLLLPAVPTVGQGVQINGDVLEIREVILRPLPLDPAPGLHGPRVTCRLEPEPGCQREAALAAGWAPES
jgi:hypothetical protein